MSKITDIIQQNYDISDFDDGHLFSTNGYQKLSNGLIIQWYNVTIGPDRNQTFTHPLAFPTGCLNGAATKGGGQVPTDSYTGIYNLSKTAVTVANGTNSTQTTRLILIGH